METEASAAMAYLQQQHGGSGGNLNNQLQNEQQVVRSAGRQAIRQFLQGQNCFACLRTSGKIVVFDTRIPIQLAFYALVEHDMQAAPLWDPVQCKFVGILTVTDFIDILRYFKSTGGNVGALAVNSIAEILQDAAAANQVPSRKFHGAESSCSLQSACFQLLRSGEDYLPVVYTEDMRVLACLTYTDILQHLVTHFREQRRLFDDSITDLGIGTYGTNLVTVEPNRTLTDALQLMAKHGLSALPVVDADSRILGVYARSDITFLTKAKDAQDAVRNLDLTLQDVLSQARQDVTTPDALRTCGPGHTLQAIFESFAQVRFHRLYVVDAENRLLGVVSAKDLVAYFLQDAE